jgi:hypothetical protein
MTETEKQTLGPTGRLVLEIPMKLWHQRRRAMDAVIIFWCGGDKL